MPILGFKAIIYNLRRIIWMHFVSCTLFFIFIQPYLFKNAINTVHSLRELHFYHLFSLHQKPYIFFKLSCFCLCLCCWKLAFLLFLHSFFVEYMFITDITSSTASTDKHLHDFNIIVDMNELRLKSINLSMFVCTDCYGIVNISIMMYSRMY